MKHLLSSGFALLSLALLAGPAGADFALTLSSPDNLSNLTVGQHVTFQVSLSGLGAADTLDSLATDIDFPTGAFTISTITPGGIVPDITGFSGGFDNKSASGNYDDLFANSGSPISANGLFFSVTATVAMAGTSGTVSLANQTAFQGFNQITPADNTPGGGLAFSISPAAAVPAPPGMFLAGWGAFLLLLARLRAQRAQQGSIARILAMLAISRAK